MKIKKAFTMAEAILVMTILGIIATIMISTLKPAEFKEKGLAVMAKKVLSEIDTATTQILMNNTANGSMSAIYASGTSDVFNLADTDDADASDKLGTLYKAYLTAIRQDAAGECASYTNSFVLKDGACIGISAGDPGEEVQTIFPGEIGTTSQQPAFGVIFFDTNGTEEPNVIGRDQFLMPLSGEGIMFAQ